MDNNQHGFWKPWRDGPIENLVKGAGVVLFFLFFSGLLGADYDRVATSPVTWGHVVRQIFWGE